jgi:adenosylmethionine-8-amino-7-oxononanoate aminotransferase
MIVQPDGVLAGIRLLCDKYDVLMIADEVAVGFGRTGRMFACEHESVQPDLLCAAKGITGGYLPLAATFAAQKIYDAFLGDPWEGKTFYHGHTYTGNPLACAAALASLDLFERNDLVAEVRKKAALLAEMLEPLKNVKNVGDIRQKGFMVGIELVADKSSRSPFDPKQRIGAEVCKRLRCRGIILRPLGDVIVLMPPLAMAVKDLSAIVSALSLELSAD